MATFVLALLFAFALTGLGCVGYYAFNLYTTLIRVRTELDAQRKQHEDGSRQWSEQSERIKGQYQAVVHKYNEDLKRWKAHSATLQAENDRLSKWRTVADAELAAADMTRTAEATLRTARAEADSLVSVAKGQASATTTAAEAEARAFLASAHQTAETVTSQARERARSLNDDAKALLDSATGQAAKLIEQANKKAEEIGGSAYEAMRSAAQYERAAKAMRNVIEGYGDQYIIPQQSLLDDLADDFSHTKAGQELKAAREATRAMVRNKTAATCGYVEANRRDTAIDFVVDAFNGKVDSILSRVKHDNVGKLEQQIRDAFTLVNYNGKAFRDAQITELFLAARLEELKWSATVQQLALEEREEQRRLKEQIREEARAEKERERALREAAKEEETLRTAMSQAQEQFERATGEQKAMYEKRLQEMADRLRESEERRDRARSMAEQTRKGYVYVISNIGSFGEDVYKIGLTRRWDPAERVRELGDSSVPFGFDVHAMVLSDDAPSLEQQLHEHFRLHQINKVNHRKEFFRVTLSEIQVELERLGITSGVHWTMTAEARDFRESTAIETAIRDNPAERDAWVKRQRRLEVTVKDLLQPTGSDGDQD